ncbi:flagellin N-terminal helical domain-containing protein [Bacillus sp. B-jedd]|uniref:flagellin N-terminal helical domain-containing protein n=1 Tax=Bacillus sp. B-jedd TaxID=1476857 RepID=UPI000515689F|nr:flagellin [Bacillus sp. B-jedd]CEG25898.1 Hag [Bacillus sp. B-jedd]
MRINHNIAALNTHRQLNTASTAQSKSMEKLSSGLKINRAGDDAAGLAISEKMRNQIRGMEQGSRNAQDGISLIQTAEGALNETHAMLQRMAELYTQAANGTQTTTDNAEIDKEIAQLSAQINDIATQTKFNTKNILDGTVASVDFQVGANSGEKITLTLSDNKAATLGVDVSAAGLAALDGTNATATANLAKVQTAINTVSSNRSNLGAVQNRLEHSINNLNNGAENLTAAESRIRDVDYALAA